MDVVELTRALVAIESVTGREGPLAAHIADRLAHEGWQVVRQPIPGGHADIAAPRVNVLAGDGTGDVPRLVFTTHLDTVPPFIPLTEDDEHLFGRGTCDAKGIFAAQWVAMNQLRARGHTGLALLGVVGEETDSIGAKRVKEILPRAGWIVDGEPTGLVMTSAAKGVLAMRVSAEGIAAHSAYPDRGRSATHALIRALARVIDAELPFEHAFGATTANVGRIEGGVAPNVIAPAARAELMVRLGAPLAVVRAELDRLLGPEIKVEIASASEPLRIYAPDGYPAAPVSFGSDVPHLFGIGTPLLVGPGSIHDAHTAGEKIAKVDLLRAVDFYVELGERLLASGPGAMPVAHPGSPR